MSLDSETGYRAHVRALERRLSSDQALRHAVGGEFLAIGRLEHILLRSLGLREGHRIVDVGCGSGRLAFQLSPFTEIHYTGCDVVPRLVEYATALCNRPDWKFVATDGAKIPCDDNSVDFVCFFSVFTHIPHEDTYRYFIEARRVLRPGGLLVMSFLEFQVASHWNQFIASVFKIRPDQHLNQFLSRDAIHAWALHSSMEVVTIHAGDSNYIQISDEIEYEDGRVISGSGSLGQSLAVIKKPLLEHGLGDSLGRVPGTEFWFIDSPAENATVNPAGFEVLGWLWLGAKQSEIGQVEVCTESTTLGVSAELFPREDVTSTLTLPPNTATAFGIMASAAPTGTVHLDLHLRVIFKSGESRLLSANRRVQLSPFTHN